MLLPEIKACALRGTATGQGLKTLAKSLGVDRCEWDVFFTGAEGSTDPARVFCFRTATVNKYLTDDAHVPWKDLPEDLQGHLEYEDDDDGSGDDGSGDEDAANGDDDADGGDEAMATAESAGGLAIGGAVPVVNGAAAPARVGVGAGVPAPAPVATLREPAPLSSRARRRGARAAAADARRILVARPSHLLPTTGMELKCVSKQNSNPVPKHGKFQVRSNHVEAIAFTCKVVCSIKVMYGGEGATSNVAQLVDIIRELADSGGSVPTLWMIDDACSTICHLRAELAKLARGEPTHHEPWCVLLLNAIDLCVDGTCAVRDAPVPPSLFRVFPPHRLPTHRPLLPGRLSPSESRRAVVHATA